VGGFGEAAAPISSRVYVSWYRYEYYFVDYDVKLELTLQLLLALLLDEAAVEQKATDAVRKASH